MTHRIPVLVMAVVTSTLAALAAPARPAAPRLDPIDRAAMCLRRAEAACALRESDRALTEASTDGVRREALSIRAWALALLDRPDDARAAFAALHAAWPGWRPTPDADARVVSAWEAARAERVRAALPARLDAGPPPIPSLPGPEALLPQPFLYAPEALLTLDREAAARRPFSLSIGAGVALTMGAAADRHSPGIHVALDFGWEIAAPVDLWVQAALALLPVDDALPVEPGYTRGLTLLSGAVGARVALEIAPALELIAGGAIGFGAFGLRDLGDASGFALHGLAGLRYRLDANLAVRLDAAPILVLPSAEGLGAAGHVAIMVRGETRF